ncbi:MAG: AEC family transporter [Oenococcus sp.]|uniref:AEC family transporter n=1 Tax=Oenococcus TaxID=46254 RepID=UPI0021E76A97|nr:AEC family transporter [Oenococcus kitaharae]MCV3295563.1 AEC family transporter [Oenococcus kitaharae]
MSTALLNRQILLMFCLMLVGYLINRLAFMHPQTADDLTKILLNIVSPCLILNAFQQPFSSDRLTQLALASLAMLLFYLLEILVTQLLFKSVQDPNLKRAAKYGSVYSNAGFMGVPLASALFGQNGVFFAVVSLAAFNLFNWTHGSALFQETTSPADKIKKILLNPNIITIVFGLIIFLTRFQLPKIASATIAAISTINTPLSMIIIGSSLATIKIRKEITNPYVWFVILLRNLLFPIAAILILQALSVTNTAFYTTVLMAACPTAGLVVLFTIQAKGNPSPAIAIMGLSTILSLVTIPAIFYLANWLMAL